MNRLLRAAVIVGLLLGTAAGVVLIKPWQRASSVPAGGASGSAKAGAPELIADGLKLSARSADTRVRALGDLLPNESVVITSEVSRRVTKVLVTDGAQVKKDEILFELDSADLAARANMLAVRRRLLVETEARQKKLAAEGLSSQAEYERAKSELDLNDAEAHSLRVDLTKTKIRAPFAGRVGLRRVSVGAMVAPATPLITLQDTSQIKVDFTVPERFGALVKDGATFAFTVEGAPAPFEGKVVAVEPRIDEGTRSLKVRGIASSASQSLVAGSSVSVELSLSTNEQALFVPSEAVIPSLGGHAVYRFEEGVAKLVDVETGARTEKDVQITSGVAAGDIVLVSNLLRLRPGAKVKLGKVHESTTVRGK